MARAAGIEPRQAVVVEKCLGSAPAGGNMSELVALLAVGEIGRVDHHRIARQLLERRRGGLGRVGNVLCKTRQALAFILDRGLHIEEAGEQLDLLHLGRFASRFELLLNVCDARREFFQYSLEGRDDAADLMAHLAEGRGLTVLDLLDVAPQSVDCCRDVAHYLTSAYTYTHDSRKPGQWGLQDLVSMRRHCGPAMTRVRSSAPPAGFHAGTLRSRPKHQGLCRAIIRGRGASP